MNISLIEYMRCDASVAQLVERILGKDEVTGSIPVRSSKNKSRSMTCFYFWK